MKRHTNHLPSPSRRTRYSLLATGFAAALLLLAGIVTASAAFPVPSTKYQVPSSPSGAPLGTSSDDFDALPPGLKAVSYSTLVSSGKVHITKASPNPQSAIRNPQSPFAPLLNIIWGPDTLTGATSGEPAAGIHPSNPLYALVS